MKILLIEAPLSRFAWNRTPSPPLGLLYLAAAIENNLFGLAGHHEVRVLPLPLFESTAEQMLFSVLQDFQPYLVGFSTPTPSTPDVIVFARQVRLLRPQAIIVVGGFQASVDSNFWIEQRIADIVVRGEGDETFCELITALSQSGLRDLEKVKGIVYRSQDGQPIATRPRKRLIDLDRIPYPARHLVPMQEYKRINRKRSASLISSRGCQWSCGFCYSPTLWGLVVHRSPGNVVSELETELIGKHGLDFARLEDDTFFVNSEAERGVIRELKRKRISIKWEARARIDYKNEKVLEEAVGSGLESLQIGVETIQNTSLNLINKKTRLDQYESFFRMIRRLGIRLRITIILGIPSETPAQMMETLLWLENHIEPEDQFIRCLFTPYTGIRYHDPGWTILSKNLSHYTMDIPLVTSEKFSLDELLSVKAHADRLMLQYGPPESLCIPMPNTFVHINSTEIR